MMHARRWMLLHRRTCVAGALAMALLLAAKTLVAPAPTAAAPPEHSVWVASRDLPSGHQLDVHDLHLASVPEQLVPAQALSASEATTWQGAVVAAPIGTGETLTSTRLLGPSLLANYGPGLVAAPVRIRDGDTVRALSVGQRVDLYSSRSYRSSDAAATPADEPPQASAIAQNVPVLAIPGLSPRHEPPTGSSFGLTRGAQASGTGEATATTAGAVSPVIVVAIASPQAGALAWASEHDGVWLAIRGQ